MIKKLVFPVIIGMILSTNLLFSQPLPPGGGHGLGGDQAPAGGGAPVGNGLVMSLVLGALYLSVKTFRISAEESQ
jgi:hypothetical protein